MAAQGRDNDDIVRVLSRLIAIERGAAPWPSAANDDPANPLAVVEAQVAPAAAPTLADFLRDHAHNAAELPRVLAELQRGA
ncbi:hypothetical protein [Arenimonas composti]|uniref:Uncharacterized protein n=1 Tax=Arenimonas composti TR7-09 = DSM 18010 TaxID=1121013 RepID=A0A091BWH6_9GAMM|nr:hypothetical protein [Arenimonas composti]KFN48700.1 hypothetical protein P873_13670 [Arenimonas composti TR7-09 = DSM 18010]